MGNMSGYVPVPERAFPSSEKLAKPVGTKSKVSYGSE